MIILLERELTDSQVLRKSSICFKEERNKINKPPHCDKHNALYSAVSNNPESLMISFLSSQL